MLSTWLLFGFIGFINKLFWIYFELIWNFWIFLEIHPEYMHWLSALIISISQGRPEGRLFLTQAGDAGKDGCVGLCKKSSRGYTRCVRTCKRVISQLKRSARYIWFCFLKGNLKSQKDFWHYWEIINQPLFMKEVYQNNQCVICYRFCRSKCPHVRQVSAKCPRT